MDDIFHIQLDTKERTSAKETLVLLLALISNFAINILFSFPILLSVKMRYKNERLIFMVSIQMQIGQRCFRYSSQISRGTYIQYFQDFLIKL